LSKTLQKTEYRSKQDAPRSRPKYPPSSAMRTNPLKKEVYLSIEEKENAKKSN